MCWSSHSLADAVKMLLLIILFFLFSFIHLTPFLLTISIRIVEASLLADGHVLVWSSLYFWYSFSTWNLLRRSLWMTLASGLVTTLGLPRRRGSSGGGIIISMETVICSSSLEPKCARNRKWLCFRTCTANMRQANWQQDIPLRESTLLPFNLSCLWEIQSSFFSIPHGRHNQNCL